MTFKAYRLSLPYGIAIASTALAILLRRWLDPFLVGSFGSFFYIAVIVSTWYGGFKPGVVATILSALAINYFFTPPINRFGLEQPVDVVRLAIFLCVALTIAALGGNLKNSKLKTEKLNQKLAQDGTERLQTALAAAQMGMWDWDMVTGEITWSPEHEQLLGLSPGSFDGRYETFDACLYPDDREGLSQALAHSLQNQVPYHHEYRVVWGDGSIHWMEGRGQAFYGEDGHPVRMSGTIMAIDERKQAQLQLQQQFEQQRLVAEMTNRIRHSLNLQEILQTTVDEVRQFLKVDRAIIFEFTPDWGGTIAVESVVDEAFALFPFDIHDPCIGDRYVEPFQQGLVTAKADIYTADISPCHVEFLAQFQVRANLVVPILKNGQLWGLLAAHHCVAPRQWQNSEIDLLQQLSSQTSVALQQANLFERVQAELVERKQAEIELRDRERLFSTLAEALPVVIFRFDRDSHCVYINNYWTTLTGRTIESVAGLGWVETLHPQERDRLTNEWLEWSQNSQQRGLYQNEGRLVHSSGKDIWYYIQALPEIDAQGETVGFIGVMTNITDLKQAEESLRQSEARLRLAQTASNSAVWDWEIPTNTLIWSPEYYHLYGLDPSTEATYENWLQCIHPDDQEWASQQMLQALEDPSVELRVEFRVMQSGGIRWFAGIGQVLRDDVGNPIRMIGITIDITRQKQAEIALQELNVELEQRVIERTAELTTVNDLLLVALAEQQQAKQDLEDLYNKAPCGYHSLDAEGTIIRINDTELSWLEYTRDQVLGKMKFVDLITPGSRQAFEQTFPQFIQRGWVNDLEFQIVAKDGSTRWVSVNATVIKDESGQLLMSRSSMFDISERKQAEQMLALQAVITRNMAEGICLVKADDATIVYANPKFEQMFGYGSGELNGQHVSIVNYPTESMTAEDVNQSIRSAVLHNPEASYEVHNVKKDGTPFWCRATCSVFQHPEFGDVLVAVHQDITEAKRLKAVRQQAEAALQQQTQQKQLLWTITQAIRQSLDLEVILSAAVTEVRDLLEIDRVAVYRFNPDWNGDFIVESVAEGWVKLVEPNVCTVWEDTYLRETQGGRFQNHETLMVSDIYTSELQPCHIELLEQFQARAYAIAPIFVGELLWGLFAIYQNGAPHVWASWEIELLQQIVSQLAIAIQQAELYSQLQIELQERERTTAVLQEAERRWRSLLDNVQLIVVGLDRLGNINYVNPFFLSLTGYTEPEVVWKSWFETFLPIANRPTIQGIFSEVLSNNAHPYYQNSILTKSGEERVIGWNNTMLQDIDGNIIGTISIGEDITERRKIDQMKQDFISVVSHELRTPLTSIRGSLGLIAGGVYDKKPEKVKEMIEIAARQSDRLVRLVNDILDLRRLESGQAKFKFHQCSAGDLIQQSVDVMRAQAEQSQLSLSIVPTRTEVWADADAIVQTLTNLLSNAIKFSPPNSTITITATPYQSASSPHPFTCFSVQDQGRGIPSNQLETIFGQFQQVDASDSREKGGTGLGLAICRTIIKQNGGKIWVESRLEQGSTFYFTLPSAQPLPDNN
jgi:PAS domain S-box-containing protein